MKRIIFVCVENSNRSQMAEAFARIYGAARVEAYSAGSRPSGMVNPKAVEAMHELGYDLTQHRLEVTRGPSQHRFRFLKKQLGEFLPGPVYRLRLTQNKTAVLQGGLPATYTSVHPGNCSMREFFHRGARLPPDLRLSIKEEPQSGLYRPRRRECRYFTA